jgi:lipid-binding SYLF domain-containing protein
MLHEFAPIHKTFLQSFRELLARFPLEVQILLLSAITFLSLPARTASAAEINRNVRIALKQLYATTPAVRALGAQARAVLVFPSIVKGGFIVGAQLGEGAAPPAAETRTQWPFRR